MKKLFKNKKFVAALSVTLSLLLITGLSLFYAFFLRYSTTPKGGKLKTVDLSVMPAGTPADLEYLYDLNVIDFGDGGEEYMAHPDSVLLNPGTENEIVYTVYVGGHGKGPLQVKTSSDGGKTYSSRLTSLPKSWEKSEETPTVYELQFVGGEKKWILISANPKWPGYLSGDGFNVSVSTDNCETWSEFQKFYGKDSDFPTNPIVAMSALVRLKENGAWADKWMGLFHDNKFRLYKTILTFDESGNPNWSQPEEYLKNSVTASGKKTDQTFLAKMAKLCEVECVRSSNGQGDELMIIGRSNTKRMNSLMAYSTDEGETWTELKEAPAAVNGERHKAEYTPDGRMVMTFRSVERDGRFTWHSEGLVMWVGKYEDLKKWYDSGENSLGDYRVKLAHVYLSGQTEPAEKAGSDTGYCGVVVLSDGRIVVSSYGKFDAESGKTYIASKTVKLEDLDKLYAKLAKTGG